MSTERLTLKWGTLKGWHFESEKAKSLLEKYGSLGFSLGAAQQRDTPQQKEIICQLIDVGDFETVYLDWDDKDVSKEEAKRYVMGYGKTPAEGGP